MRKSRYTEEQIEYALKQTENGEPIFEICNMLGVSERTFYRWKSKFNGLIPDEICRVKQLEMENIRLKRLIAELVLDKQKLQDELSQRWNSMPDIAGRLRR